MVGRLSNFLRLPGREKLLVCQASVALIAFKVALTVNGVRPCLAALRAAQSRRPTPVTLEELERIGRAVRRASAGLAFGLDCLPQSLAAAWMMARRGVKPEVRFGARTAAGAVEAHAWVEAGELGWRFDSDPAGGFAPFEKPHA